MKIIFRKEMKYMKVIENLNVTCDELFKVMMESFAMDYKNATKKDIKIEDIKAGLSYKKKTRGRFGFGSTLSVEILELEVNRKYVVKFTTKIEESIASYEMMPKGKKGCMITYTEDFTSDVEDGKKIRRNDEDKAKMRLRKMFKEVEKNIIKNRGKEEQ